MTDQSPPLPRPDQHPEPRLDHPEPRPARHPEPSPEHGSDPRPAHHHPRPTTRYPVATPRVPADLLDTPYAKLPQVPSFELTSTDVATGHQLPTAQTSGNISPQLSWRGFPRHTESFVVTMYDQDATTGSGLWHWVVYDLPATKTSLEAGAGTPGSGELGPGVVQARNDIGVFGYTGAAPPVGKTHRYFITVSALNIATVPAPSAVSPALLGATIVGNVIARATLVPIYTGPRTN